ncbi:MAG: hypothetical protein PUC65_14040 [Clostridiales bacterium]|nr:hypothetical protein [Clostridiales bacterium]
MEKLAISNDVIIDAPIPDRPISMEWLIDMPVSNINHRDVIGYSVFYYANYMHTKPELKLIAIDGVLPNNETIRTCEYPYVNDFYVVIRKDEDENSNARKIFDWMTSLEAQKLETEAGYVPVVDMME